MDAPLTDCSRCKRKGTMLKVIAIELDGGVKIPLQLESGTACFGCSACGYTTTVAMWVR